MACAAARRRGPSAAGLAGCMRQGDAEHRRGSVTRVGVNPAARSHEEDHLGAAARQDSHLSTDSAAAPRRSSAEGTPPSTAKGAPLGPAPGRPAWSHVARCFIWMLGPPAVALSAAVGALGWLLGTTTPLRWWHGALYGGLALAGLALSWLAFAWRLHRLLRDLATLLPTAARRLPNDGAAPAVHPDPCVQFVLLQLRCGLEPTEPARPAAGLLDFVQPELATLQSSPQGAVLIDTVGIILWANSSLCEYFGYTTPDLLQANVRVLMPQSYAAQHDHFLRRHLRTNTCTILGGSGREVPVLRRDGTQALVWLTVEDRTDPRDEQRRLFLGRMDFRRQNPAIASLQAQLRHCDRPNGAVFHPLDDAKEAMVAIAATGIVLYCNAAAAHLFCWSRLELVGQNVKVLMAEPFASAHDGFLRKYVERDEACREQGRPQCASNFVGSGRDVIALTHTKQRIRVFLAVSRLNVQSNRAADCTFLARLIPLPGPDTIDRRQSTAASLVSDGQASEAGRAVHHLPGHLPALVGNRSTVVVLRAATHQPFEVLLNLLLDVATQHRGRLNAVAGGQAVVTFNTAALPNSSHRSSAAAFMLQLTQAIARGSLGTEVRMAAVSRPVHSVNVAAQEVLTGEVIHLAGALLKAQAAMAVSNPVVDGALHEELQYSYTCRQVNRVVIHPESPQKAVMEVFELLALKESSVDEWMYQLSAEDSTAAAWVHWHRAWAALHATSPAGSPANHRPRTPLLLEATAALQAHLTLWPEDPPAQALLSALQIAEGPHATEGRVEYSGCCHTGCSTVCLPCWREPE